jgi:septal ring factor EnvC (AmiA/AmiB activator)
MSMLSRKDDPKLPRVAPMPTVRPHSKPDQIAPTHPAVAQHVAQFNDMAHDLDSARAECSRLHNELEIERRTNAELQHTIDAERSQKERFQRYAVALNTHVATLHAIAAQALDESQKAALAEPPKKIEPPISADEMEAGVAEIAAKFAPKQHEPPNG